MKWNRSTGAPPTGSPGDKRPPKPVPVIEFNVKRQLHGWPQHDGKVFGPAVIHRALQAGFYVLATIAEAPHEVAVSKARLTNGVLEVLVGEGWRFPLSVRTVNPADMRSVKL